VAEESKEIKNPANKHWKLIVSIIIKSKYLKNIKQILSIVYRLALDFVDGGCD